jgi:hypothetical protein
MNRTPNISLAIKGLQKRLILLAIVILIGCTEELAYQKSAATDIKLLQNGRNLEGAPFHVSKNLDGTYQFYYTVYFNSFTLAAPYVVRVAIDANGNFLSESNPQNEIQNQNTVIEQFGPHVFDAIGTETFFAVEEWNAFRDFKMALRFGPGKKQKAHRFVVPLNGNENLPDDQYYYQDYVDVPFEAWDVTRNRQLMVSFRDQDNDTEFNLVPYNLDGTVGAQSLEYIVVQDRAYNEANPYYTQNNEGGRFFDNQSAYFLWPYLPEGGSWNPSSLPIGSFGIYHQNEVIDIAFKPLDFSTNFYVPNFYVRQGSNDVLSLFDSNYSSSFYLSTISFWDQDWKIKGSKIINSIPYGDILLNGFRQAKDGSLLMSFTIGDSNYGLNQPKIKFLKLNADLTTNYEFFLPAGEFNNQYQIGLGRYEFAAKNGKDFLLIYNTSQGPALFEIDASGITKLGNLSFPNLNVVKTVTEVGGQFAVLSENGKIFLFDENLLAPQIIELPSLGVQADRNLVSLDYEIFSVDDKLYFTAYLHDDFNQVTRKPKFMIGRIETSGSITFKEHEFGSNITSATSSFYGDGAGVHLLQIQTSTKVNDLMLFENDGTFNIK